MIDATTSMLDVAGAIAAALRELNYDSVVVGGSAATLHAPEAYRSRDVDMVIVGGIDDGSAVIAAMAHIGFVYRNGFFFHDRSSYTVDFVPSPVAIAGDVITEYARLSTAFGEVRVLHSADVVNDRLNKYIAYDDPDSFEVAVMVARIKQVDLKRVEAFIERQAIGAFADSFHGAFVRLRERLAPKPRILSPIGFTTAFRIRFRATPTIELAQSVARAIQAFLDEERSKIDSALDGVTVRPSPSVTIDSSEASVAIIPIEVSTKRDLAPIGRFAMAAALVDYLRERVSIFPELVDVPDQGTPPVATTGF